MTIFPGCKCCGPCWRCYKSCGPLFVTDDFCGQGITVKHYPKIRVKLYEQFPQNFDPNWQVDDIDSISTCLRMDTPEDVQRALELFMQKNISTQIYNEYAVPYNPDSSGFGNYKLENSGTARGITANVRCDPTTGALQVKSAGETRVYDSTGLLESGCVDYRRLCGSSCSFEKQVPGNRTFATRIPDSEMAEVARRLSNKEEVEVPAVGSIEVGAKCDCGSYGKTETRDLIKLSGTVKLKMLCDETDGSIPDEYQCFSLPPTEEGWTPVGDCHKTEEECDVTCPDMPPCIRALGFRQPSAVRFHVTAEEERGPPWVDTDFPDSGYMPLKDDGHVKVSEIIFNAIDVEFDVPLNKLLNGDGSNYFGWDWSNPISEGDGSSGARVLQGWSLSNELSRYCSVGVLATQRRDCFLPEFAYYGSEFRKLEFYLQFEYEDWVPRAELKVKWTSEWHGMGYQVPTSSGFSAHWPAIGIQKAEKGDVSTTGVIGKTFKSQEGNDGLVLDDAGYSVSIGGEYKEVEGGGGGFCLIPVWDNVTPAPNVGETYAYMVGQTSGCVSPYYGEQRRVASPSIMATATFLE